MSKIDCEIIKDLLPNYVEDLVSEKTKQAVDEHVKTCKPCKEDLDMLQEEKIKQEKEEEEIEINHLKKYNKKLFVSKIVASMLASVIVVTLGIFLTLSIKYSGVYKNGKYVSGLIEEAYSNTEKLKGETNLEFIEEEIRIDRNDKPYISERILKYKDKLSSEIGTFYKGTENEITGREYLITVRDDATKALKIEERNARYCYSLF